MSRPAILDALTIADRAVAVLDDAIDLAHAARYETDDEHSRDELHRLADDLAVAWRHAHRARTDLQALAATVRRPVTPLDVARRHAARLAGGKS